MATDATGDADATGATGDAELARRLQILATEHWGLLAARSTAQSEVLTRITIHLTLVSAGLVTIGLLGQATHFASWFAAAALGILGMRVTYSFFRHRGSAEQVLGSSMMLSVLVNATVTGMFAGGLCVTLGMPVPGAVAVGILVGLCVIAAGVAYGGYRFLSAWRTYVPLSPSRQRP